MIKTELLFLNSYYLINTILLAWGIILKADEYLVKKKKTAYMVNKR